MAVKIANLSPTFRTPATVYLPGDDGAHVAHQFEVEFRRVKGSERDALSKLTLAELLDRVVTGWGGMRDAAGAEVPYSQAERRATEDDYPGTEMSMAVAFWDHCVIDQRAAAAKNSAAPSVTA